MIRGVDAGRIEKQIGAGGFGFGGIGREATGDEVDLAVETSGHAVDGADEGATAAADHAQAEFAMQFHSENERV